MKVKISNSIVENETSVNGSKIDTNEIERVPRRKSDFQKLKEKIGESVEVSAIKEDARKLLGLGLLTGSLSLALPVYQVPTMIIGGITMSVYTKYLGIKHMIKGVKKATNVPK